MDPQQQQQKHETSAASQAYDHHQSYYNNNYYYHPNQQHPSYYPTDYASSQQNPAQQQIPNQPISTPPPPGVSATPHTVEHGGGTAASTEVPEQSQQNVCSQAGSGGWDQTSAVAGGLNPVVAAAAMVLAQFAGTMGEGGLPGQVWNHGVGGGFGPGQPRFRPGSTRPPGGGGSFRGRGRGNFRKPMYGRGRSGSSFRGRGYGRGRGRGGSRSMQINGAPSSPQKPCDTEQPESIEKEAGSSADCHEEEAKDQMLPLTVAPAETNATTTSQKSSQVARCELCKIECTSLEILEQHYNGKRHKKNLQKMETARVANEPVLNSVQAPIAGSNADETLKPENLVEGEGTKQILTESSSSKAVCNENQGFETHSDEAQQAGTSAEPQHDAHEKEPGINLSGHKRQDMKRKMQHGRGGKRMKQESRKPKVVIPLICDLCNVKCDTQEVFNRHLAGKKHIAKLKRFEGHQATFGSTGVQALYPPNPMTQILLNQGSQQGVHLQHSPYPLPAAYMTPQTSHPATAAYMTPQASHPAPAAYMTPQASHPAPANYVTPQASHPAPADYVPPQASHSASVASCAVPIIQQNPNTEASNMMTSGI